MLLGCLSKVFWVLAWVLLESFARSYDVDKMVSRSSGDTKALKAAAEVLYIVTRVQLVVVRASLCDC